LRISQGCPDTIFNLLFREESSLLKFSDCLRLIYEVTHNPIKNAKPSSDIVSAEYNRKGFELISCFPKIESLMRNSEPHIKGLIKEFIRENWP